MRGRAALVPGGDEPGAAARPARWSRGSCRCRPAPNTCRRRARPARARPPRRPASGPCSTSASTRAGLPEPPTIGSGAGDHDRAGGRQPGQVLQLGQAVLARPEQRRVAGERRVEASAPCRRRCRPSRRRSRCTGASLGQPAGALDRDARACAGRSRWRSGTLPGCPTRASQPVRYSSQPPSGSGPCSLLPLPRCGRPRAGSPGPPRASALKSSTTAGRDQLAGRDLGHVLAVPPVTQCTGASKWVPVCSPVRDVVPVPGRAAVVVAADLLQRERHGVAERRRQLDHGVCAQRRGQVDDLDVGRLEIALSKLVKSGGHRARLRRHRDAAAVARADAARGRCTRLPVAAGLAQNGEMSRPMP